MPGTALDHDVELIIEDIPGGGGGSKPPVPGGGGDDGSSSGKNRQPVRPSPRRYFTGITVAILSILMFFMALASAFIVRRSSNDWVPVHIPAILWANTLILLVSSLTLELSRRRLANLDVRGFRALWIVTTGLGILFVTGQVVAWRQLLSQGIFVATNPASSFFYIFTGLHGLHLLGGLVALLYVLARNFDRAKVSRPVAAEIVGHYWHFMDALWIFLLALLYLGK
jgi:cytochrome c oxidase subunit III